MQSKFPVTPDTKQKIKVDSSICYALWIHGCAHAGLPAGVDVSTAFVGEGAPIEITVFTDSGKKIAKISDTITRNRFTGEIDIPENASAAQVYFEAKLPKHGLKMESNLVPLRPAIKIAAFKWDRAEVKRGEIVTITCQFSSGVEEEDEATVIIYEHNPNCCDFKVASIPAVVKNNKIELQWKFEYHDDTKQIPTKEELEPYKKQYANPCYYFIVVIDGVRIGEKRESGILTFKDSLEIQVIQGRRTGNKKKEYVITFADKSSKKAKPDQDGWIRIADSVPGPYFLEPAPKES